jgi:hypothetical protein
MLSMPNVPDENRKPERRLLTGQVELPSIDERAAWRDVSFFIWQRLSDIDLRMGILLDKSSRLEERVGRLDEKVGRLDEKVGRLDQRVGHLEEKVGEIQVAQKETRDDVAKIKAKINIVQGAFLTTSVVAAAGWTILQFVIPHLSWN